MNCQTSRRLFQMVVPVVCLACCLLPALATATELVKVTRDNWSEFVPRGKEVDCIYGDYVLRNDQVVIVIAQPIPGRNANMTVRNVGGAIIDLTRRQWSNDQLSAFYPDAAQFAYSEDSIEVTVDGQAAEVSDQPIQGDTITFSMTAPAGNGKPQVTLTYLLTEGQPSISVESRYHNPLDRELTMRLGDSIRADRSFASGVNNESGMYWAYDEWFRQAYGVIVNGRSIQTGERGALALVNEEGSPELVLPPDGEFRVQRRIFSAGSLLQLRTLEHQLIATRTFPVKLEVVDPQGAVNNAKITVTTADQNYASGRTGQAGKLQFRVPAGKYVAKVEALGRPPVSMEIETGPGAVNRDFRKVELESCGYVVAQITDPRGNPLPAKVAFIGQAGTADPFFGIDSLPVAIHNLVYTHNGQFRQEIGPGKYEVIISLGPEYDAVFQNIEVRRGEETQVAAQLNRVVDSRGWISADFHSHSSPSGDNTSHQRGRVLNLLAEHIEFAPCTEHNRIDSYVPHLKALNVEHLMATCSGMELTGQPLPVNHQNAFPLVREFRQQDGGAPVTDGDPVTQIRRLAMWDDESDKLVQGNHPNLVQILGDRDEDGKPDGGFREMLDYMDVVEVHPPAEILQTASPDDDRRRPIFHWLQLLNMGYRIAGVVNTDAHYNFHGSGPLRNYLRSSTDEPEKVNIDEMVRTSEAGHIVMTNGPYLEASMQTGDGQAAGPGETIAAANGKAQLRIRVQCANWLDVNRVQVFLNGRPAPDLNFTRREASEHFADGVTKFEASLPIELKQDTHVIVCAAGEGLQLGRVMGPSAGKAMPIAVTNPIFVDVDGDGFQPNGDLLDYPLPLSEAELGQTPGKK